MRFVCQQTILMKYYALFLRKSEKVQSNLGYPNVNYPKLLGYSKTTDSPYFFLYYLLQ